MSTVELLAKEVFSLARAAQRYALALASSLEPRDAARYAAERIYVEATIAWLDARTTGIGDLGQLEAERAAASRALEAFMGDA